MLIAILASYATYVHGYQQPNRLFWDENYHVASAQKYLDGVFFMEPHPPLGILAIAAGELLLTPNTEIDTSKFLDVEHIKDTPPGFSFTGVRLFPVIFAWGSCILFFLILYSLSSRPVLALLFSSLLIFDNAMITHFRSAMLEPTQVFFVLLFVLVYVRAFMRDESVYSATYFTLALAAGTAISVKINAGILLLFFPFLYLYDVKTNSYASRQKIQRFCAAVIVSVSGVLLPIVLSYFAHFSIAKEVREGKDYQVIESHQAVLRGETTGVYAFFAFLNSAAEFTHRYEQGVPSLRPDAEDENGSHPIFWPVGKKSISYRWDKTNDGRVRHLRLHTNPFAWGVGAISVLYAFVLVVSHYCFSLRRDTISRKQIYLISVFLLTYLGYMGVMLQIERVMYLYHYFIPLLISYLLGFLLFTTFFTKLYDDRDRFIVGALTLGFLSCVSCFWFFSPFSYHVPLDSQEFAQRNWFPIWRMSTILW